MNKDATLSIVREYDKLCFSFGDQDAIEMIDGEPIMHVEIQEYSKSLACQLAWRFDPDYCLIDCQGWAAAEAVSTLACMRMGLAFVPVSCYDQHNNRRLNTVVDLLRKEYKHDNCKKKKNHVVAVTVCDNDRDPILSIFQQAGVHQILYLNPTGMLLEQLPVPTDLPAKLTKDSNAKMDDALYVLFTSGTTTAKPKAVVGSHQATLKRLQWFRSTFSSSSKVGRRTKLTFVDGFTELWSCLLDASSTLVSVLPARLEAEGFGVLVTSCTQLLILPSQLRQLSLLPSHTLERVMISGEPCSASQLQNFWTNNPEVQLINLFGQTETTGDVLFAVLKKDDDASIVDNVVAVGRPIGDTQIELTTENEIVVSGGQLSNGYLGQDEPFTSFLTGDVGFCRNGIWYVKGRINDVIKLNGVWTSPTEIESSFCGVFKEEVEEAVAIITGGQSYLLCPSSACQRFSRDYMHNEVGIPWNLVPRVVFQGEIPRQKHAAGKVDRKACEKIIMDMITKSENLGSATNIQEASTGKTQENDFASLVCDALAIDRKTCHFDLTKSFVDMGGDSASAITLLYLLRQKYGSTRVGRMTAVDLLLSKSLKETEEVCRHGRNISNKRHKRDEDALVVTNNKFFPHANFHSSFHKSIDLRACMDATPLEHKTNGSIYAGCQGGIVIRFTPDDGAVQSFFNLQGGWMIQADLLLLLCEESSSIIACAHSLSGRGLVLSLSTDLKCENWRNEFDFPIKSAPVLDKTEDKAQLLWIVSEYSVVVLDSATGQQQGMTKVQLPHRCLSKPLLCTKANNDQILVCASSDWEGGLMIVDTKSGTISCSLEDTIGPVTIDLCMLGRDQILICDSYGAVHTVELETIRVTSTVKLSNYALSSPLIVLDDRTVVVGSHDGKIFCFADTKVLWEYEFGTASITKPLQLMSQKSIIVCTTGGHVIKINSSSGKMEWNYRIGSAEIWSNPILVLCDMSNSICFGARDSRIHIVDIPK